MNPAVAIFHFEAALLPWLQASAPAGKIIDCTDLSSCRFACDEASALALRSRMPPLDPPVVLLLGSGDYHYLTALRLELIREPFSLVLFDNHTDAQPSAYYEGNLVCSAWILRAASGSWLQRILLIGADPESVRAVPREVRVKLSYFPACSLSPEDRQDLSRGGVHVCDPLDAAESARLATLPSGQPLYLSVDKDVLDPGDASTNWNHGTMRLSALLELMERLSRGRRLLGMDICGEPRLSPLDCFRPEMRMGFDSNVSANRALIRWFREHRTGDPKPL